jgi:branched-chain amino acid transport system substrate-binding protein
MGAAAILTMTGLAGCGSSSGSGNGNGNGNAGGNPGIGGTVTIGASIPLSGALSFFGQYQKWGYQHAVTQVNATGGVEVGGKKEKVNLVLLDDQSDPATAVNNIQTLVTSDHAVALLGSCTPPLVNPGALIAERMRVPMVTGCDPVVAFTSVRSWNWVWDLFFYEPDLAQLPFETLKAYSASTNHKVAILHDNGPDGLVVGGKLWPTDAARNGYQVVVNTSFSTTATDFSAAVAQAKASGADIVLVDCVTPQAIAIRKQMATAGYAPKVLDVEKGAEPFQYSAALGSLANGTLVGGYWSPALPYPGAADLANQYQKQTGNSYSQHIADSYTAAMVLLAAIGKAGSAGNTAINQAIAATTGTYPVGPVKFGSDHAAVLGVVELQWQNGKTVQVWPTSDAQAKLRLP